MWKMGKDLHPPCFLRPYHCVKNGGENVEKMLKSFPQSFPQRMLKTSVERFSVEKMEFSTFFVEKG